MILNPLLSNTAIFSQEKPKLLPALSFPKFGISFKGFYFSKHLQESEIIPCLIKQR